MSIYLESSIRSFFFIDFHTLIQVYFVLLHWQIILTSFKYKQKVENFKSKKENSLAHIISAQLME